MNELTEKSNVSVKYIKGRFGVRLFSFLKKHPLWQLVITSFLLNFAV